MEVYSLGYYDVDMDEKQQPTNTPRHRVVNLKHGLKIECSKFVLDNILSEKYIRDNFNLNIKHLENGFYSVYFDGRRVFEVFNKDLNDWERTEVKNIKDGDIFRIFQDGHRYSDRLNGNNIWIAKGTPYLTDDNILGIDTIY